MSYQRFSMGKFQNLPQVTKTLLIINIAVFILCNMVRSFDLTSTLALYYFKSTNFKVFQLVTHMFVHGGLSHLFFNMIGLYIFGSILENLWGPKRFLNFYLGVGLGAALLHWASQMYQINSFRTGIPVGGYDEYAAMEDFIQNYIDYSSAVGASGAISGLLLAFAMLFPNTELYLYMAIPIKAKWLVAFLIFMDVYGAYSSYEGDNIAHFAHLGGYLFSFVIMMIWRKNRNFFM